MTSRTSSLRIADAYLDELRVDDVRAVLQVDVETLDPSRPARGYRIEFHTAAGCVAGVTLGGARALMLELERKLRGCAPLLDATPGGELRAVLQVAVELHTGTGRVASVDFAGARKLIQELAHKLQVAAAMQSDPPARFRPTT